MQHETRHYEFVVVGGGMAGICAAIAAARRGLRTALVQDRPVLGGNAGKEIRFPLEGADGGRNNRYARETGILEELRLENLHRNPLGNAELWDTVLLDAVYGQENLELYLNTVVTQVEMATPTSIRQIHALTLGSERRWTIEAPLFADCTGDGSVAHLAGAEFRTGREGENEFGESLSPPRAEPFTLGSTILFALKDAGRPVPFVAPKWAHRFTEEDLRHRRHHTGSGYELWWVAWGGELDPVLDSEAIKLELLKIVYGLYDHLKNGPEHAATMSRYTLEWVGSLPGKRESRRFLGDYVLTQQDLVESTRFEDAVAIGGGSLEQHPSRGFFSPDSPRCRFQLPGLYTIPYRCLYSRNVRNLFLAGRQVSVTHVALCSTRALATCGQLGEAVGAAAFHCLYRQCLPADLTGEALRSLQQDLLKSDHYLLGLRNEDPRDLARAAQVMESSSQETALEQVEGEVPLDRPRALMLPLAGKLENISLHLRGGTAASISYTLCGPDERGHFFPGEVLARGSVEAAAAPDGEWVEFPVPLDDAEPGFYWLLLEPAQGVRVSTTDTHLVGVLSFEHEAGWEPRPGPWRFDRPEQNPFSPWRKVEANYCFRTDAWIPAFYGGDQVTNGFARAHRGPNLWVSAPTDFLLPEWLELRWEQPREVGTVYLYFNTDLDRELPNLWQEHDFRTVPECVRHYRLLAWTGTGWKQLLEEKENHQRYRVHRFPATRTTRLRLEVCATHGDPRAHVYEVRVYGPEG